MTNENGKKGKIAILGAGSWATAIGLLLEGNCYSVKLWSIDEEQVRNIRETGENSAFLPGIILPDSLVFDTDLEKVISEADLIVLGVPSHAVREVLKKIKPLVKEVVPVVNLAKGIEEDSLMRISEVFREEFPAPWQDHFVVLSGPSHAEEVGRKIPTAVVVAGNSKKTAELVQDIFMAPYFRVYTNPDVTGVELGGSLKNVIALGTGISDGLGFGDNTKAALITRGLAEMTRLGKAMGARILTFAGLAGIGDLVVTCTSMHSRNRRAGILIGQGKSVEEAIKEVKMVVEGVRTARAVKKLVEKYKVEMPIAEQTYQVLFGGLSAREAVTNLMGRSKTHEIEEVAGEW